MSIPKYIVINGDKVIGIWWESEKMGNVFVSTGNEIDINFDLEVYDCETNELVKDIDLREFMCETFPFEN